MPIAAILNGRKYAMHTDHLNTPRRLSQANGRAVWQWAYSAFGEEQPTKGSDRFVNPQVMPNAGTTNLVEVNFNLRYPGQYFDQESGLYYNYFRSYSPNTGEYTQPDPIGLKGGWNRFVYAGGNSISGIDPWGLETCVVVTRGTGGVGTHTALYMSNVRRNENNRTTTPVIYDPAGSYSGRDNFSYGPKADLNKFADYHKKKDGETTEKTCKNTTAEEEQRLYEKALAEGPQGGLACFISVSNVVSGSSYFPNVKPGTFFPGNLFNQARR